jgi:hypothetical protein
MRMVFLAALAWLGACATSAGPPAAANASDARDCAVMSAVLKQHYKIEPGSRLHIQRGDPGARPDYPITCDFKAAGIAIEDYDYGRKATSREDFQGWVSFSRPHYPAATSAIVETGYLLGPLAGAGRTCTLRRAGAGWIVETCEMTWVS